MPAADDYILKLDRRSARSSFRAGLVPLDRLRAPGSSKKSARSCPSTGPGECYAHTASSRAALREFGSKLITRYLSAFSVENDLESGEVRDVTALKMLVVVYVIRRPNLAVVQYKRMIYLA